MKRMMIVAVVGLLGMSSVAEACDFGRANTMAAGYYGGGVQTTKIKIKQRFGFGGGGLFHRRAGAQAACGMQQGYQAMGYQTMGYQTFAYAPPVAYQAPQMVYQMVAPPVTYAAPQSVAAPQAPLKSAPQAVAPPQVVPQPPSKSTPQR